ncbi:MAG TPA: hypothetical protein VGB87_11705, partial [Vicinamibacteria bacterium]
MDEREDEKKDEGADGAAAGGGAPPGEEPRGSALAAYVPGPPVAEPDDVGEVPAVEPEEASVLPP